MRPSPPARDIRSRDVHVPLGVLAYTGAASVGRQLVFDPAAAGWHESAPAGQGGRRWRMLCGTLARWAPAALASALVALLVLVLAYPWRSGLRMPSPVSRQAAAVDTAIATVPGEAVQARVNPRSAAGVVSVARPVVPPGVLAAAAASSTGLVAVEAAGPPPHAPAKAGVVVPELQAAGAPARVEVAEVRAKRRGVQGEARRRVPSPVLRHLDPEAGPRQEARSVSARESIRAADDTPEPARHRPADAPGRPVPLNDVLVAIQDVSTAIVANRRGMPTPFRVGERLPSGAVLISVDPRRESVETDRGTLKLE